MYPFDISTGERKVKKIMKYLHKSKELLLNTNNNCHSFQVRGKVVSLNNLNSITTPPENWWKKLGLQEEKGHYESRNGEGEMS